MEEKTRLLTVSQFAKAMGLDQAEVIADVRRDDFYSLFAVTIGEAVYIEGKELMGWRVKRLPKSCLNIDYSGPLETKLP